VTAWGDYLAAAQRLDVVRREVASMVDKRASAAGAARADLSLVRQRIALQRARLLQAAADAGAPPPQTDPAENDVPSVRYRRAARSEAVQAAVRRSAAILAEAEAVLSTVDEKGTGWLRRIGRTLTLRASRPKM
jgi:hypothetical protein